MVVRAEGEAWNPVSGQMVLDFQVAELARRAQPLAPQVVERAGHPDGLAAEDWYHLALELEVTVPAEAVEAYRSAFARAGIPDA